MGLKFGQHTNLKNANSELRSTTLYIIITLDDLVTTAKYLGEGILSCTQFTINKWYCSFDYDSPYIVALGQGRIILGMDRGLVGTCLWERRRITFPPSLGYGERGVGDIIPPNATLVFYIRLIKLERVFQLM